MGDKREITYAITMSLVRKLLNSGAINEDEYTKINETFIDKYNPKVGQLFSELP